MQQTREIGLAGKLNYERRIFDEGEEADSDVWWSSERKILIAFEGISQVRIAPQLPRELSNCATRVRN